MFKSKLDKFIAKRAAVLLILLTAADIIFLGNSRWLVLIGVLAGFFISLGKFSGNEWMFKKISELNGEKAVPGSIIFFTVNQLMLLPVMILTYFLNSFIFYGLIAGILTVPIIIMINSITEAFGITKNSFE